VDLINLGFAALGGILIAAYFYVMRLPIKWEQRDIRVEVNPLVISISLLISSLAAFLISLEGTAISAIALGAIFFAALIASYVDWYTCKIPNELIVAPLVVSVAAILFEFNLQQILIMLLTLGAILFASVVTNFITIGKLGGGDIKLLLVFGLISYWYNPMNIFYGMLISFILQLVLRVIWNKKNANSDFRGAPFGYALSLGIIQSLLIF
jgi:Flp pilus assembly protein protease CpaA